MGNALKIPRIKEPEIKERVTTGMMKDVGSVGKGGGPCLLGLFITSAPLSSGTLPLPFPSLICGAAG